MGVVPGDRFQAKVPEAPPPEAPTDVMVEVMSVIEGGCEDLGGVPTLDLGGLPVRDIVRVRTRAA